MFDLRVGVSAIVPVHNGAHTIANVVQRLLSVKMDQVLLEMIVVNDGSVDATHEVCRSLTEHIDVYRAQPLQDRDAAVRLGWSRALGEVILVVDADIGIEPMDVPKVLTPILAQEADVVFGVNAPGTRGSRTSFTRRRSTLLYGVDSNAKVERKAEPEGVCTAFRSEIFETLATTPGVSFDTQLSTGRLEPGWRIRAVSVGDRGSIW